MQKAVEPENDAGFPKHNYSQLNGSCYSYPSKPRLQCCFRLHIYGISKWLHTTATAQYQRLQPDTGMKYKKGFFFKTLRSEVMASFTHLE